VHAIDCLGRPLRASPNPLGVFLSTIVRHTTLLLLAATIALAGCGTAVYDHQIEIAIQDHSGPERTAADRRQRFEKEMGSSEE
jgi:hypothetical protein